MIEEKSPWAPDAEVQEAYDKPLVPDLVGTDIRPEGDQIVVDRAQDVEPILDYCKRQVNENVYRTPSGDMHHAAEFPLVIVEKYLADKGITFQEFLQNTDHVKSMMADPALRDFCIARNVVHRVWR